LVPLSGRLTYYKYEKLIMGPYEKLIVEPYEKLIVGPWHRCSEVG
jgi:hypothetical protein